MRLKALLCAGAAYACAGAAVAGEPYTPANDAVVLAQVAPATDPQVQALERLRQQLAAQPQDLSLALDYARRALTRGRAEADPRYDGYAEAALAPWWHQPDPPTAVRLLRATILQRRHAFDAALRDLDAVLAAEPDNAQAHLSRAVVLNVQARYGDALRDCAALRRVPALVIAACAATPRSLSGEAEAALASIDSALLIGGGDSLAWALTQRGEIAARLGRDALAETSFRAALATPAGSGDLYLHLAYADFLLAQQRPAEVLPLVDGWLSADGAKLRQVLALKQLAAGGEAAAHAAFEAARAALAERFAAARLRPDFVHQREAALFELHAQDDPQTALADAVANWRTQREPTDARIYLEAALAAGRPASAAPVLTWLQDNRIQAVRLRALAAELGAAP